MYFFNEQDWKSNKAAALGPVCYELLQHNAARLCKYKHPRLFPEECMPPAGAHRALSSLPASAFSAISVLHVCEAARIPSSSGG